MNYISPSGFNSMNRKLGEDVLIFTKTPTRDDDGNLIRTPLRDDDGNLLEDGGELVYNEDCVTVKARITLKDAEDKDVNGEIEEVQDAIGGFEFKDAEYLQKGNILMYTTAGGFDFYFEILPPVPRMTFIHVTLKGREPYNGI
jgi:hypothetical protein